LGGEAPTVTDGNVVLGTLDQRHLLGGRMPIDPAQARAAVAGLASRLGLGIERTAQGIVDVVTSNMAKAIRIVSVQRGHDPRGYTLVAFGGAGPLHAARLARELAIPRVLVPRNPGILCALGLLLADLKTSWAVTRRSPLVPASLPAIREAWSRLDGEAQAWLDGEGVPPAARRTTRSLDMRYAGQNYELSVPWPEEVAGDALVPRLAAEFEAVHRRMYGYVAAGEPVEVVALRLEATAVVAKVDIERRPPTAMALEHARAGSRQVFLPEAGGIVSVPVYDRERLGPGHVVTGPALVDQMDATTLILPGQRGTVDPWLALLIEERAAKAQGD
jgi:N-methylhydantoinase A